MESVVLIGEIGSGKTTLFNKITQSNEATVYGGESVTRCVFQKTSNFGKGFKVNDTPGTGVMEEKITHCAGILAALAEGPLSRIILVVKFERTPLIVKQVIELTKPFQRFKPLITIAITHFDLSKDQVKHRYEISLQLSKLNILSAIYIGKDDNGENICKEIDEILSKSIKTDVILNDYEYLTHMDLVEYSNNPTQAEIDLEFASGQIQADFKKLADKVRNKIPQIEINDPDITNKMQALMDYTKKEGEQLVDKYLQMQQNVYNQLVLDNKEMVMILVHYRLKKSLSLEIEDIVEKAQQRIKINQKHCFNFIKKCNYCKKIWLKVEGCDLKTHCGSIPIKQKDNMLQQEAPPLKYDVLVRENDVDLKLNGIYVQQTQVIKQQIQENLKKQEIGKIQKDREKRNVLKNEYGETVTIGEFGCGQLIDWRTMETLTEGELKELVDPGLQDYYKAKDLELQKEQKTKKEAIESKLLRAIQEQKQSIKRL